MPAVRGVVNHPDQLPVEGWTNPDGTRLTWHTLMSADRDASQGMAAGITRIPVANSALVPHRHAPDELYFVVSGRGVLVIDDEEYELRAGTCAFVPGGAWHAIRNPGPEVIELFYVFAMSSFADVVYEYAPGAEPPVWD